MKAARVAGAACALALSVAVCSTPPAPKASTAIVVPKIWDEKELEGWATPLAGLGVPPSFFSEKEYYAAPIDNLRTYPVYHPSREPAGYREWMKRQGPRPLIEPSALSTKADWIEAGRRVFEQLDTAASRSSDPLVLEQFSDPRSVDKYMDSTHDVMTPDGVLLDYLWVVDLDGTLKLSSSSCGGCHTRLMPDGSLLRGAPSNFDLADSPAADVMLRQLKLSPTLTEGQEAYAQFGVPWVQGDRNERFRSMSHEEFDRFDSQGSGEPPGTMVNRFNGSPFYKTRMADLRGIRHRKYLDATGTHLHRGPEDLARYCILVEFADCGVFGEHKMLPPDAMKIRCRPPDEAVYAMALYLESLEPAPSPHPFDDLAKRGQKIFEAEECIDCHTPPFYTNNKLVPVPGFEPPAGDPAVQRGDVSTRRVGTDPGLALRTRKGTGYYKVPSLRGVWYRGLYEHDGSAASLEDWFDPKRLSDDYVPSGWRGPGVTTRAVPGHKFGHDLSAEDKRALIAFLRTL
jgi:mono/diheme cytochrome c family protein